MQTSKTLRLFLLLCGFIATAIGAAITFIPAQFHAGHGFDLAGNANLASEVRASGAALMTLGLMITSGAFVARLATAATALTAAVYSSYGAARLVSLAVDGAPDSGLLQAMGLELLIGAVALLALARRLRAPGGQGRVSPVQSPEAVSPAS